MIDWNSAEIVDTSKNLTEHLSWRLKMGERYYDIIT